MLASFLIALLVSSIVTQITVFCTTIYLHRAMTHRSIVLHPGGGLAVPRLAVADDGPRRARMGGGAPEASRVHRRGRRSAQPAPRRLLVGAARQRVPLRQRAEDDAGHRAEVREGSEAGHVGPRALRSRPARPVDRHRAALPHARHRLGTLRRGVPRVHVRVRAVRVDQRAVPLQGLPQLREHRHEHPLRRVAHRRRGPAQQSPRLSAQPEVQLPPR